MHRLKGPAEITKDGERYFINGTEMTFDMKDLFIKILTAPISEVPLYMNHGFLGDVAKERLRLGR
jgi:hypothetical protein